MSDVVVRIVLGIALAIADFWLARRLRRGAGGDPRTALEAAERLLDARQAGAEIPQADVATVRDHLLEHGYLRSASSWGARLRGLFFRWAGGEKLNLQSPLALLVTAAVLEFAFDLLLGFHYATTVQGYSLLTAILANLYQIPALWVGLWLGRWVRQMVRWLSTAEVDRKLHDTLDQLVHQTGLLEIVVEAGRADAEQDVVMRLTRLGRRALRQVGQAAGAVADKAKELGAEVANYGERQAAEQRRAEEQARERFDDITRGR